MSLEITEVAKESKPSKKINWEFAQDVQLGLINKQKFLPSKYLYNKQGDQIFQEIMAMPEYYLTRAEHEIFSTQKSEILEKFSDSAKEFQLIEFGAGDGMKTKVLLQHFVAQQTNFHYIPIDISANILSKLTSELQKNLPALDVQAISDDYFSAIEQLNHTGKEEIRKVVLFLGANIGNFSEEEAKSFLHKLSGQLSPADRLMIGFDLKKNPNTILNAYFDKEGITGRFDLNLLQRINEELDADFALQSFQYFPIYDPMEGAVSSYLVSQLEQEVQIKALNLSVHFEEWETILIEQSRKFSLQDIEQLAEATGFQVVHHFFDKKQYFTDSVWELKA